MLLTSLKYQNLQRAVPQEKKNDFFRKLIRAQLFKALLA